MRAVAVALYQLNTRLKDCLGIKEPLISARDVMPITRY